jgi:hypothetical protein
MSTVVPFDQLADADLQVGAIYEGGSQGNVGDDPLARLLPCGNQGGFRFRGERSTHSYRLALMYTSGSDPDWPDSLDPGTGVFTYFGDNKTPGSSLHDTARGGNELLRFVFDSIHTVPPSREQVPPFFVFRRAPTGGRDVEFLGLAVPGAKSIERSSDLVAVWRTTLGQRFQNYRAIFTVLDIPQISRAWINELAAGDPPSPNRPDAFRKWAEDGTIRALEAPKTAEYRTPAEQLPIPADRPLVSAIYDHYRDQPHNFEACAIELWKLCADDSVTEVTATRPSADGGRDAFGHYSVGPADDRIHLDFSLEAKCYGAEHGCGVRETSRLISRLRHRQFGVFVTTSYVSPQAYRELREDSQPVVVISGRDIAGLLKEHGISTTAEVKTWLTKVDGTAQV